MDLPTRRSENRLEVAALASLAAKPTGPVQFAAIRSSGLLRIPVDVPLVPGFARQSLDFAADCEGDSSDPIP
jgi:hypothetical protein